MKSFFLRFIIGIIGIIGLPHLLLAAEVSDTPGKIHHFTIIAPPTAKVGEAIDITVEARDKDDRVIEDYRGSIFFQSETDFGATIPAQGKAIQFKESDNGVLKISKGVIFKRVGNQELLVTEAIEDVGGSIKIRVEDATSTGPVGGNEPITITTPEARSTVTSDTIVMSGKSKKNSKITIKLNGKEIGTTQTNDDGLFTYRVVGIDQASNVLSASVLDGTNAVIGSVESSFSLGNSAPTYYNISIMPSKEVDAGSEIIITVDAEPSLSEVGVTLDGVLLAAKEQSPGKYRVTTVSPAKAGTYALQVGLKNMLGQSTSKPDADTLSVKEVANSAPKMTFKNVTLTSEGTRVNFNFFVENAPSELSNFKIAYGETADALSNEVTTFTLDKIRRPDGSYNWYIDKLDPKTYSFKIFGIQTGGVLIPDFASETLSSTIGKGECSIGNIDSVETTTLSDKTILSWKSLTGALSYNVYRVTAAKDYELVKNVKENSYTLYLSSGALEYQDFAVKALCDDKTESSVPAIASRVQTGPGLLTILVITSSLLSIFFIRRRWTA